MRNNARRHLGRIDDDAVQALIDLWNHQGRRCFYSGVPLSPGPNMHIDHITPRSKGGDNEINNVQWVSRDENMFKSHQTHEEFIEHAHLIAERFERPSKKNRAA